MSISKGELLDLLEAKGHKSPGSDAFKADTEAILFEKFGLDQSSDELLKSDVKEQARVFQSAMKKYYSKYGKFSTIFSNNPVRKFSTFIYLYMYLKKPLISMQNGLRWWGITNCDAF